jgi:hypothetical protein
VTARQSVVVSVSSAFAAASVSPVLTAGREFRVLLSADSHSERGETRPEDGSGGRERRGVRKGVQATRFRSGPHTEAPPRVSRGFPAARVAGRVTQTRPRDSVVIFVRSQSAGQNVG